MKFLNNLKLIFDNSPLILSETQSPEDVSINRVMIAVGFLTAIVAPLLVIIFCPEYLDKLLGYWNGWLTFLGVQVSGNIAKKFINKGGQS